MRINHSRELFRAQAFYMQQYAFNAKKLVQLSSNVLPGQVIQPCSIHPSAEIHPYAKIGPNVTIGAEVRVGEGARIANSIILEDAMIHSHAVVMHAIIGWTTVIGSWARIEGIEEGERARVEAKMNRCRKKGE